MIPVSTFDLKAFLQGQQARVEALLHARAARLETSGPPVRRAEAMRYSLMAGGTRLRPTCSAKRQPERHASRLGCAACMMRRRSPSFPSSI